MPVSLIRHPAQTTIGGLPGQKTLAEAYLQAQAQLLSQDQTELSEDERLAFDTWFVLEHLLPNHRTVLSRIFSKSGKMAQIS
ncbi:MAG: hypothetical protein V9G14_00525 [Cypionkella sp.]